MSLRDAAARRDLTINSLYWDPVTEDLIDCFGGAQDLDEGILRHTSDAFTEDPLRALRLTRFAAILNFDIAPETAELARTISHQFTELPTSRILGEVRRVLRKSNQPSRFLSALVETGWIENFPNLDKTRGVVQDPTWHPEGDVFTHLALSGDAAATASVVNGLTPEDREVVVLGSLVHDLGKATHTKTDDDGRISSQGHAEAGVEPAETFMTQLGIPRDMIEKVLPIVAEHMCTASHIGRTPTQSAVRRFLRRLNTENGGPTVEQWAAVVTADQAGRGTGAKVAPVAEWLRVAATVGPPQKSLLLGSHLARAGYQPNPAWQAVINAALIAQDDGAFDDEAGAEAWFSTSGLIPIGYPMRPSPRQRNQSAKWAAGQA
jgi:tRNA nucleotidyltransferase (CCA-adding enzyme)